MAIIAKLRELRRLNEEANEIVHALDASGVNWRLAIETGDEVSLDPATLFLLFKLLLLFLKYFPLLSDLSSE